MQPLRYPMPIIFWRPTGSQEPIFVVDIVPISTLNSNINLEIEIISYIMPYRKERRTKRIEDFDKLLDQSITPIFFFFFS